MRPFPKWQLENGDRGKRGRERRYESASSQGIKSAGENILKERKRGKRMYGFI